MELYSEKYDKLPTPDLLNHLLEFEANDYAIIVTDTIWFSYNALRRELQKRGEWTKTWQEEHHNPHKE